MGVAGTVGPSAHNTVIVPSEPAPLERARRCVSWRVALTAVRSIQCRLPRRGSLPTCEVQKEEGNSRQGLNGTHTSTLLPVGLIRRHGCHVGPVRQAK